MNFSTIHRPEISPIDAAVEGSSSAPASAVPTSVPAFAQLPSRAARIGRGILIGILIMLGLGLGAVAAVFIGLFTGWIQISC